MSSDELQLLDEFNKLVQLLDLGSKVETQAAEFTEHMYLLLEARNKPVQWAADSPLLASSTRKSVSPVTYADLKKFFDRICACNYWNKELQAQLAAEAAAAAAAEQAAAEAEARAVAEAAEAQRQADLAAAQLLAEQQAAAQAAAAAALVAQQMSQIQLNSNLHHHVEGAEQGIV
jgi:hypothetical protein